MSDPATSTTPPHASLRVLSGPSAGSSIRLTGRVVIGRGDSADLVIDDGKLSREHVEVAPAQGAWRVTDLGSRNGTSVNGDTLSGPQVLAPGDRIAIGLVEITYVHESAPPSRLRVLVGARAGTECPLTGQRTTIGRGSEADIALDDGSASRENSAIALVDGIWHITDLDSRNGTALAGDRLPADRPTRLWAGAPLRIGASTLELVDSRVDDRAGTTLCGYTLLAKVGSGTAGSTWRARGADGAVALKLLDPGLALDPREGLRFVNAARAQARIDHPNVLRVLAVDTSDGQPWAAVEWLAGGSLASRLTAGQPLPPEQVLAWMIDLARALQAADEKGVVHRGLRPTNVLFDGEGAAVLTDLALCAAFRSDDPLGSPDPTWISPEEASGAIADARANQYSLGAILFQCLSGKPPFVGADRAACAAIRLQQSPSLDAVAPQAPAALAAIVARLMDREPTRRYGDWAGVSAALAAAGRGEKSPAPAVARPATGIIVRTSAGAGRSITPRPYEEASVRATVARDVNLPPFVVSGVIALVAILAVAIFLTPSLRRGSAATPVETSAAPPPAAASDPAQPARAPIARPTEISPAPPEPVAGVVAPTPPVNQPAAVGDPPGSAPVLEPALILMSYVGGTGDQTLTQVAFTDDGGIRAIGRGFAVRYDAALASGRVEGDAANIAGPVADPADLQSAESGQSVDPRSGLIFTCGTRQVHPVVRQPFLNASSGWSWWGWTHEQIQSATATLHLGPLIADAGALQVWPMPDGRIGVASWCDGANATLTRDPRDLAQPNPALVGATWPTPGRGPSSLFMLVDGADGTPLSGTFVPGPPTATAVDAWGRVYLARAALGHGDTFATGGRAGMLVLDDALQRPLFNSALGGLGGGESGDETFTAIALRGNLLVLAGTTAASALRCTDNAVQRKPGGGQDGFLAVIRLWE